MYTQPIFATSKCLQCSCQLGPPANESVPQRIAVLCSAVPNTGDNDQRSYGVLAFHKHASPTAFGSEIK